MPAPRSSRHDARIGPGHPWSGGTRRRGSEGVIRRRPRPVAVETTGRTRRSWTNALLSDNDRSTPTMMTVGDGDPEFPASILAAVRVHRVPGRIARVDRPRPRDARTWWCVWTGTHPAQQVCRMRRSPRQSQRSRSGMRSASRPNHRPPVAQRPDRDPSPGSGTGAAAIAVPGPRGHSCVHRRARHVDDAALLGADAGAGTASIAGRGGDGLTGDKPESRPNAGRPRCPGPDVWELVDVIIVGAGPGWSRMDRKVR